MQRNKQYKNYILFKEREGYNKRMEDMQRDMVNNRIKVESLEAQKSSFKEY